MLHDQLRAPRLGDGEIVHHLRSSEFFPPGIWGGWQRSLAEHVERRYLRSLNALVYNTRTTRQAVQDLMGGTPHPGPLPQGERA